MNKQVVTLSEAAEILGVRPRTIGRWIKGGRIKRVRGPLVENPSAGRPRVYVDLGTYISYQQVFAKRFKWMKPDKAYTIRQVMDRCGCLKQAVCYAAKAGYLKRTGENEYVVVPQE